MLIASLGRPSPEFEHGNYFQILQMIFFHLCEKLQQRLVINEKESHGRLLHHGPGRASAWRKARPFFKLVPPFGPDKLCSSWQTIASAGGQQ